MKTSKTKRRQNKALATIAKSDQHPIKRTEQVFDSPKPNSSPTIMAAMSMHSGPLPPPNVLAGYGQVRPDLPDIIVQAFTGEIEHRRKNENKLVEFGIRLAGRGQLLGFIVVLAVLGLAAFMVEKGMQAAATVTVGIDIVGLAGLFIYGSSTKKKRELPPSSQKPSNSKELPPKA